MHFQSYNQLECVGQISLSKLNLENLCFKTKKWNNFVPSPSMCRVELVVYWKYFGSQIDWIAYLQF